MAYRRPRLPADLAFDLLELRVPPNTELVEMAVSYDEITAYYKVFDSKQPLTDKASVLFDPPNTDKPTSVWLGTVNGYLIPVDPRTPIYDSVLADMAAERLPAARNTAVCEQCGTWLCKNCCYANRNVPLAAFVSGLGKCKRCGSSNGEMRPVTHLRSDFHKED